MPPSSRPRAPASSDAPYPPDAWEPISLGSSCVVKFQTSRRMYFDKYGEAGDLHECRRTLLTPNRGSASYERHVFDWAITPFSAVMEQLESGFVGAYEREDLILDSGEAVNRRFGTRHPHDFHASDPAVGLSEADIDAQYDNARGKFDHLARRFGELGARPGRYLYVFEGWPYWGHVERVLAKLGGGAEHDFRLLLVGYEGDEQQPHDKLGDRVEWTQIPREVRKAPEFEWEGDDGWWDTALAPYRLWPHRERMVRSIDEPEEPVAKPGLLGKLGAMLGR